MTAQRPWHIEYAAHMACRAIVAADGKHVAYCVQELSEADAELLAAGPRLLDACWAIERTLSGCVAARDTLLDAIALTRRPANWQPFYFDGNQAWGLCSTPADWERIKANYRKEAIRGAVSPPIELLDSYRSENTEPPQFGFRALEYTGAQTLREFFAEHGMDPGEL